MLQQKIIKLIYEVSYEGDCMKDFPKCNLFFRKFYFFFNFETLPARRPLYVKNYLARKMFFD